MFILFLEMPAIFYARCLLEHHANFCSVSNFPGIPITGDIFIDYAEKIYQAGTFKGRMMAVQSMFCNEVIKLQMIHGVCVAMSYDTSIGLKRAIYYDCTDPEVRNRPQNYA